MKGVVGKPGTTVPTAPSPKKLQPSKKYSGFICFSSIERIAENRHGIPGKK